MLDIVIMNARIIDGTGNSWFRSDIAVKDGKIQSIGRLGKESADRIIDAGDLITCPGFVDIHTHSDLTLLANPKAESKVRQGVTTEVIGNCGFSVAPVKKESSIVDEHILAGCETDGRMNRAAYEDVKQKVNTTVTTYTKGRSAPGWLLSQ